MQKGLPLFLLFAVYFTARLSAQTSPHSYDVHSFGAKGDGVSIDTDAINHAIIAAHEAGGGVVIFTSGVYASFSIHLMSNVTLLLSEGSTLLAAEPGLSGRPGYDVPEANPFDRYQDFGHSHWHNSLIWGEDLENIAIVGPGRIYGRGLSRGVTHALRDLLPEERDRELILPEATNAPKPGSITAGSFGYPSVDDTMAEGVGNKAIALKNCHNVLLRDFSIYHGGHFGIYAYATDNLAVEHLAIDTNRDGMDIDSCVEVHISDCSVNAPWDDGICLKSCFAGGRKRPCENVTITNCNVSGYLEGTLLDGTRVRLYKGSQISTATGRIKFGTESNGGFKNVTVSNCTFDFCRGLALEIVDGGTMEDVSISNLTMRDIGNSAIYVRLGERNREPNTATGRIRRINISNVVASGVDPRFSSIVEGSPDHPIEDLSLSNIRIEYRGGGASADAAIVPPENPRAYPEPEALGTMPAYGLFVRHVRGMELQDVHFSYAAADARPAFVLQDVIGADLRHVRAAHEKGVPVLVLRNSSTITTRDVVDIPDLRLDHVEAGTY